MPRPVARRSRNIYPACVAQATITTEDYSGFNPVNVYPYGPLTVLGTQVTESESHDWPPPSRGPIQDRGGNFFTQKKFVASPKQMPWIKVVEVLSEVPLIRYTYDGGIFPQIPGVFDGGTSVDPFPPDHRLDDNDLDQKGATAIARCKPGDPVVDLSTTFGETIKDGLPALLGQTLWRDRTLHHLHKNAAGEYLNAQFGFLPLVNDIRKSASVIDHAGTLLKQFERDAGRNVRRSFYFPVENIATDFGPVLSGIYPGFWNGYPAGRPIKDALFGDTFKRRDVMRRVWFSGTFTYSLPADWNSANKVREISAKANALLNTKLTPETLWNLAPWSWAIDWFSSAGDVVSNLQSFITNGLVMRYGYVMAETIVTDTYTHVPRATSSLPLPRVPEVVFVTHTKQRKEANPFGFGVSWDGLSPFQVSIAAALGINRK
jgi:hypothetical protein